MYNSSSINSARTRGLPGLDRIAFHNVAELEPAAGNGVYLRRVPRSVREHLNERGRFIAGEAGGCELRFVTAAPNIRVTLSLPETDGCVTVFKGGLFHSRHELQAGTIRTLQLSEPPRLAMADRKRLMGTGFAPEVWRICFGRYACVVSGIETFGHPLRPPQKGETPLKRWIAYGSSITHGEDSSLPYIGQTARRLAADVLNLGMSGSCHCEREMSNYLAAQQDWSFMTLELGVNMRDHLSADEFRERTGYLLDRLVSGHPEKPVAVITIYPNFAMFPGSGIAEKDSRFNDILRSHVERLSHPKLHLIEGDRVLDDLSGLSCDLIHPGDDGHIRMGENLARELGRIL